MFFTPRKVSPILITTYLVYLSVNYPVFIHTDLTVWVFNSIVIVILFSLPQNHYRYGISHKIICMHSICHSKIN